MSDVPIPEGPFGLLISRDLIFNSKVTGTARALGRTVTVAGNAALARAFLAEGKPLVVFLDLAAGDLVSPSAIEDYRSLAPGASFVAFGSHVDTATLEGARRAGCEHVMPRSKFTVELPGLIRTLLPGD
jgi:DNA-binding NarL/FixJ family response regulator